MAAQPAQPEAPAEEVVEEEAPAPAPAAAGVAAEEPEVEAAGEEEAGAEEVEAIEEPAAADATGEKKIEKFGVQTEKGKLLLLFRNGDKVISIPGTLPSPRLSVSRSTTRASVSSCTQRRSRHGTNSSLPVRS